MRKYQALVSMLFALTIVEYAWGSAQGLWKLYEQRDFFSLRDHLPPARANPPDRILFLHAATEAAFGDHKAAIVLLHQLLNRTLDKDIEGAARRILMREERADYRYSAALAAIAPLLQTTGAKNDPEQLDLRNSAIFLAALSDVAPERTLTGSGPAFVNRGADGRFLITLNGHSMKLGFDTGADFSFLAASTARAAGLKTRHVNISLGSSTGVNAGGDVAIGDLTIGTLHVRNVVFLILPDAGLTMPDGFFMPGLLGFPVMAALGAIRYGQDGSMQLGASQSPGAPNLALEGNHVLLRIEFKNEKLLCRLDTGADNTVFYEPFYRRFPEVFTEPKRMHALKLGGVSGVQEIPAYELASVDIRLAGVPVHLSRVNVMERSIETRADNYLDCNVGMDALNPFKSYTIDLKHLRLDIARGH